VVQGVRSMKDVSELRPLGAKGDTEMGRRYGAWMTRRAEAFAVASSRYFKVQAEKAKSK
jgi:hypothetical protein